MNKRQKKRIVHWRPIVAGLFLIPLLFLLSSAISAAGETWIVTGDFQESLAASSCLNWANPCADTIMDDTDGDGVSKYTGTGLAAGSYAYKIVEENNWDNAHPADNVALTTTGQDVTWYIQEGTNNVADNVNQCIATAVGSWQSQVGGPDWEPTNLRTMMWQESAGSDWYSYATSLPAGNWEFKVARDEAWTVSHPASNIAFVLTETATVTFRYNCTTNDVEYATDAPPPPPEWVLAGNLQDELTAGTCGEWDNACVDTAFADNDGDGVYRFASSSLPAGSYEYKVVEYQNWDNAHPADNVALAATGDEARWYFAPATNGIADNVNQCIATAVGDWQDEVGGPEWAPANLRTMMWQEVPGSDWYAFEATLPAGNWQAKVARDEAWDVSHPVDNVPFELTEETAVTFRYNCATNEVQVNTPDDGASHDNDIWWDDLGHNSFDGAYRTPSGAVTTGTAVTLRLRAASNDLTEARVRVWDDRNNVQTIYNMSIAADDGTYEWWEATIPASAEPTIYWYRFIAIDGTATAYYEDDDSRNSGWGQPFAESPDNSWQITVYDPSFQTPDWVQNGIIYQIFPERFRDGDPSNNPGEGEFHYNIPGGSIVRSNGTDWHEPICDPRNTDPTCFEKYGQNFYGGDLQGIIDELDYLQELGVTVIYLNPIFDAPSNHKYDTTDFSVIDPAFGDLATFQTLSTEADARGISLVLDGVFNHSSSDSIYFDRYNRYAAPDGACESETSPFRAWFHFQPAPVPGSGACAGDQDYESWFGFDSLPKLDSGNEEVRDYFYQSGPDAIGRYWMQWADGWRLDVAGDVDPGVTNDPNNDYWEGFRTAVHTTNPDAYIVGEEWGNSTAWLLGDEWDASMNYQFGSAIMSFWRDTTFIDNDHNAGSSAGILEPIVPSELDARLHYLEERYPEPAFHAMMNLLGSHDTNRALFMLDENTGANDDSIYQDPNYDWSDAIVRLRGVALLQMTMPGAPTIYYGDEVGLVGPVAWDGSTWQDDPYNRLPMPWLDETGTPYYTHLQSQASQDDLFNYYKTLTGIRNGHPALRTGSFDTLLTDDANNVYGYGRLMADYSDAAVVLVNRGGADQSVTVNVAGYLPIGAEFEDALNGGTYTVAANGDLTVGTVPAMSGAILVPTGALNVAPAAVSDLAVTAVRSGEIDLAWSAAAGADSYDIYRSLISGGGYELVTNVAGTSYTDTGLENAVAQYYVVVARNAATGLASDASNEVSGVPAHDLSGAWYNLQWPPSIVHTISTISRTENIYGQIWIDGVTSAPGATDGLLAQVGYGADGSTPDDSWTWETMTFNADAGNNDEFVGSFLPDMLGTYDYATRYSSDGGANWVYADLNGPGINGNPGDLQVVASSDTMAPAAPLNLAVTGSSNGHIALAWDANGEADLAGYEIYRQHNGGGFARVGSVDVAATTFSDESVTTSETYEYYVVAFDTSFNRSAASNTVEGTAEPRLVSVTFTLGVPEYTVGTVYIVGDLDQLGPWNPGLVPMTQVDDTTWTITLDILDGTSLQYKFTRGNWETVEATGSIVGLTNRELNISYGTDGTQAVDLTATDWGNGPDDTKAVQTWRDPIVVAHSPAADAVDIALDTAVSVEWSLEMELTTSFTVSDANGAVAGTVTHDDVTNTTTFVADGGFAPATTYTVDVTGQESNGNFQQVPVQFSFTTRALTISEQFAQLNQTVDDLVAAGELSAWDGWLLSYRLEKAEKAYDKGKLFKSVVQLSIFKHHVRILEHRDRLSEANADLLKSMVNDLRADIWEELDN